MNRWHNLRIGFTLFITTVYIGITGNAWLWLGSNPLSPSTESTRQKDIDLILILSFFFYTGFNSHICLPAHRSHWNGRNHFRAERTGWLMPYLTRRPLWTTSAGKIDEELLRKWAQRKCKMEESQRVVPHPPPPPHPSSFWQRAMLRSRWHLHLAGCSLSEWTSFRPHWIRGCGQNDTQGNAVWQQEQQLQGGGLVVFASQRFEKCVCVCVTVCFLVTLCVHMYCMCWQVCVCFWSRLKVCVVSDT